jgi:hypothetical protein
MCLPFGPWLFGLFFWPLRIEGHGGLVMLVPALEPWYLSVGCGSETNHQVVVKLCPLDGVFIFN